MKKKILNHPSPVIKLSILFHPWVFFGIFLTSLTLLSYFSLSLKIQLWLIILGLVSPFSIAVWIILEEKFRSSIVTTPKGRFGFSNLNYNDPPLWLWILFISLILITRFYKLTALPFWPFGDEDLIANLAMGLDRDWIKNMLFSEIRLEPLFIWISAFFFKYLLSPSLLSIRLIPALISIASILAAYWASRKYLTKSMAFIFTWLFSFSFFEMTLSRLLAWPTLAPLLQFLCLGLFAHFLESKSPRSQWAFLFLLCLSVSLGFYACTTWPAVWLFLLVIMVSKAYDDHKKIVFLAAFLAGTILLTYPMIQARLSPSGMSHIKANFNGFIPWESSASYGSVLFWDSKPDPPFSPNWGGYLNPLLGSLALIGFFYFLKVFDFFWIIFSILGFLFSLLPAILSNSLEIYRLSHAFPFFLASATLGIRGLASVLPKMPSWRWIACLLLTLLALDVYKYFWRFCGDETLPSAITSQFRSVKYFQIYKFLEQKNAETGPLHVFTEFNMDYENKVINAAIYSFNIVQNLALTGVDSQWTALVIPSDEGPFLQKRFPHLEYVLLPQNVPLSLGLFFIPTREIPPPVIHAWIEADHVYQEVNFKIRNRDPILPWDLFTKQMVPLKDKFQDDPFLQGVYWEKVAFFKGVAGDYQNAAFAYQRAIQKGYPMAHLYYDLGLSLKLLGRNQEAQRAFQNSTGTASKEFIRSGETLYPQIKK